MVWVGCLDVGDLLHSLLAVRVESLKSAQRDHQGLELLLLFHLHSRASYVAYGQHRQYERGSLHEQQQTGIPR